MDRIPTPTAMRSSLGFLLAGQWRRSPAFATCTVAVATFVDTIVYGIFVPVLPFALEASGVVKADHLSSWSSAMIAAYGAGIFLFSPIAVRLTGYFSTYRLPFLVGLLAMACSVSLMIAIKKLWLLLLGRFLQGVSSAFIWTIGLAVLVDKFGTESVGPAMGHVVLAMNLAMSLGPILGGIVYSSTQYFAIFALLLPLILLDVTLRLLFAEHEHGNPGFSPRKAEKGTRKLDNFHDHRDRHTCNACRHAQNAEMFCLPDAETSNTSSATGKCTNTNGTTGTSETQVRHRGQWWHILRNPRLLVALLVCMMQAFQQTSLDAILPVFTNAKFGYSAMQSGLMFLAVAAASFLSPLVGHLSDRYGPRLFIACGCLICCPSTILLRLVTSDTIHDQILLAGTLFAVGCGLTCMLTPAMSVMAQAVEESLMSANAEQANTSAAMTLAYGLFTMVWSVGCVAGPLLSSVLPPTVGWDNTFLIWGCLNLLPATLSMWILSDARITRDLSDNEDRPRL